MNVSAVTMSSQTVERDGRGETLMSPVDPDSATIFIVPALPLREVGRIAFTARQRAGCPSHHGSGGSGGGPSCPYCPKGVAESYRSTNIVNSIPFRRWGILRSQLDNAPGVRLSLCLCLNLQYRCSFSISLIFLIILFADLFVVMLYIVYFISFCVQKTIIYIMRILL